MKKVFYILVGVFFLTSCFDDEGNYNYSPINEFSIKGFGEQDTVLDLLYLIDTLRIDAALECSLDKEVIDDNYTWRWELEDRQNMKKKIVANTRKLELPINITPGMYNLYLRVKDNETGIIKSVGESLNVGLTYSKGLLVLGDRENGDVQLDMIAMVEARNNDTIILKDMLKDTDLPPMKNAIAVFHTGANDNKENVRLWIMSETGSYYLNSETLTGDANNNFSNMFYTSLNVPADAHPVECYPRLALGEQNGTKNGFIRGFRLSDGSFVFTNHLISELYSNPINRLRTEPDKLLKLFPGCLYSSRYMKAILAYDVENDRFLGSNDPSSTIYLDPLYDMPMDKFPFDQKRLGRKMVHMENTRNPLNANRGRSYALLRDSDGDFFIYCFYVNTRVTNNFSLKIGYWQVRRDVIKDIEKAEKFLFSSTRPAFYYLVDNKVYCYSFNKFNESCEVVADFGTDEVTWWDVDLWTEETYDYIWVATYNPETGGTLSKYKEPEDQNESKWIKTSTSWEGFPKIKSVAWRNCSY